jgi:hypothetical protein
LKLEAESEAEDLIHDANKTATDMKRRATEDYEKLLKDAKSKADLQLSVVQADVDAILSKARTTASTLRNDANKQVETIIRDAQTKRNEIITRQEVERIEILQEARTQAQKIVAEAQSEGEKILNELTAHVQAAEQRAFTAAEEQSQEIIDRAKSDAERIRTEAEMAVHGLKTATDLEIQKNRRAIEAELKKLKTTAEKEVEALRQNTERDLLRQRRDMESQVQLNRIEVEKELNAKRLETEATVNKLKAEHEDLMNDIEVMKQTSDGLQAKVDGLKVTCTEYAGKEAKLKAEFDQLKTQTQSRSTELAKHVQELETKSQSLLGSIKTVEEQRAQAQAKTEAAKKEEAEARQAKAAAEAAANQLKLEGATIFEEAKKAAKKLRDKADVEFLSRKEREEQEFLRARQREGEETQQRRVLEERKLKDLKKHWSLEISRHVEVLLASYKGGAIDIGSEKFKVLMQDIQNTAGRVLEDQSMNSGADIREVIGLDVALKARKQRKLHRRLAVAGTVALLAIGIRFIPDEHWPLAGTGASLTVMEQIQRATDAKPKYVPAQTPELKDSYTDNVVFTLNYSQLRQDEKLKERWTLELNRFFLDKLKLGDNTIVKFSATENGLITSLLQLMQEIKPETEAEGLQKLRDYESTTAAELRNLLVNEVNFEGFKKFERVFWSPFLRAAFIGARTNQSNTRGMASETK